MVNTIEASFLREVAQSTGVILVPSSRGRVRERGKQRVKVRDKGCETRRQGAEHRRDSCSLPKGHCYQTIVLK